MVFCASNTVMCPMGLFAYANHTVDDLDSKVAPCVAIFCEAGVHTTSN